ncbi:outer membrane protein transport protein [Gammaproteobacteria bacterium]|nr:outer membrane protein transport protein [Gammaproteobacteria bacterium]
MKNLFTKSFAALTIALLNVPAQAAGLWLYEMGTPDVGTASAGMTSRAQDAATAFANPAGMTRLKESQFMLGVQPIYADIKSDVDVATFGGSDGGNAGGLVPAGGLFYVHSLSQDLKLGFSAGSYLGLGVDFDNDWAGRYYIQKEEFTTAFANGSVGYRVNDWLSAGAGVSIVHGELEYRAALNNQLDGGADGRIKFDDTDADIGFNAGLLIEPREGTRVGLTYISEVDFDFKDKNLISGAGPLLNDALQLSGLAGATTKLKWVLPEQVMLGIHQDLSDTLSIMGNVGWQNWSKFGEVGVSLDSATSRSTTVDANFDDTWHVALGARYRVSPLWSVSAGVAYDSSPVSNSDRSIALALDEQYRYAVGAMYDWRKDITLGVAFEYMDAGDASVNQKGGPLRGDLKSDFKNDDIYFLALSMNWKF